MICLAELVLESPEMNEETLKQVQGDTILIQHSF